MNAAGLDVFLSLSEPRVDHAPLPRGIFVIRGRERNDGDRAARYLELDPVPRPVPGFAADALGHGYFGLWFEGNGHDSFRAHL